MSKVKMGGRKRRLSIEIDDVDEMKSVLEVCRICLLRINLNDLRVNRVNYRHVDENICEHIGLRPVAYDDDTTKKRRS